MALKKNLWVKVAAVVASLVALATTLGLVHRNPPASSAATPSTASASVTQPRSEGSDDSASDNAPAPTTQTHTRTHVS